MTNEQRLVFQREFGSLEVIQYDTDPQSTKITKDLTSQNVGYGGHTLATHACESGIAMIVAMDSMARILDPSYIAKLKLFILDKVSKPKMQDENFLLLLAEGIPIAKLSNIPEKIGRAIICADRCKLKFFRKHTGDATISVSKCKSIVKLNLDGTLENLGDTFEVPRASSMNLKNDWVCREIDEEERVAYRNQFMGGEDLCEVVLGDPSELDHKNRRDRICHKDIEPYTGGGHIAVDKSSGDKLTLFFMHGKKLENELPENRTSRIDTIIEKITPENLPTDKIAALSICYLTDKESKEIAIKSGRSIITGNYEQVIEFIDAQGDFKLTSLKGLTKYTPVKLPSGEYICNKELLGKELVVPRSDDISRQKRKVLQNSTDLNDFCVSAIDRLVPPKEGLQQLAPTICISPINIKR